MSGVLNIIRENYNFVFYELCDERTRDNWPNFGTLFVILFTYVYFVKKIGPAWMKDKEPFELKNTIIIYNITQIILSAYLFYGGIRVWIKDYNWTCQPVNYSNSPSVQKAAHLIWLYTIIKLIDLMDTVFFVLRKKDRQISGLHVYHHFMMPLCSWMGLNYYPNGHGTLLGVINCFVHVIMYSYYLIAGLGPQYQKYLWWKKHVTSVQLLQFVIIFFHNIYPLITGCNYPKWINVALSICSIHFIYMFGNFYYVNYIKTKPDNKNLSKDR